MFFALNSLLIDLDLVGALAHFDEGTDVDRGPIVLDHIVGSVHIHEDVFVLELSVLIFGNVVDERFL